MSERELVVRRALEDSELRPVQAFIFGGKPDIAASSQTPDLVLLSAISQKDATAFRNQVADLERRRVSPEKTWFDNDCLIFCLLLGCEVFEVDSPIVKSVLDARDQNRNPIPRKVNEVFRSLSRKEHALSEEFAFIKVVYDHLRGQLKLSTDSAIKIYNNVTQPKFCEELSPFISLLAIRAYDLVVTERKPSILESFPQLIEAVEKLGDKLSIRQTLQLLMALPVKSLLVVGGIAATIFSAGLATERFSSAYSLPASRPELVKIASVQDGLHSSDHLLDSLASSLVASHHPRAGMSLKLLLVKTEPIGRTTSKYSAEISLQNIPILDGYAFSTQDTDAGIQRIVLPVRRSGEVLKVFVPAGDGTSRNEIILLGEVPASADLAPLNAALVIRVLE